MTAETLSSETARWKARTESDDELLLSYDTISILRPSTPPLALISSAAICAPPGVAAPAIDCTSAMTPILIGSEDCAWAAGPIKNPGDPTRDPRRIAPAPANRAVARDGCIRSLPLCIFVFRCAAVRRRAGRSVQGMAGICRLKA